MSGEGIIAAAPPLAVGTRVLVEHPRYGRHYGRVVSEGDRAEQIFDVKIEGGYINVWQILGAWMTPVAEGQRDMVIGDLLNLAMLKTAIEVEFIGTLWVEGDSGPMTPYVCEASFGDGMHLLTISTINQRPNYHVVRVCSSWRAARFGYYSHRDCDIGEHIDDVLTAIEEECGRAGVCLDDPCDNCRDTTCKCGEDFSSPQAFPALDDENGCSWGHIRWPWLMKEIGYAAVIDRLAA